MACAHHTYFSCVRLVLFFLSDDAGQLACVRRNWSAAERVSPTAVSCKTSHHSRINTNRQTFEVSMGWTSTNWYTFFQKVRIILPVSLWNATSFTDGYSYCIHWWKMPIIDKKPGKHHVYPGTAFGRPVYIFEMIPRGRQVCCRFVCWPDKARQGVLEKVRLLPYTIDESV